MRLTRRNLFAGIAALLSPLTLHGARDGTAAATDFVSSLVDTLIPQDQSPGALDAGLDGWLRSRVEKSARTRQSIEQIETACNRGARLRGFNRFGELDLDNREQILNDILYPDAGTEAWVLEASGPLMRIRHAIVSRFYLSAEGQESAGYRPPWPHGYR